MHKSSRSAFLTAITGNAGKIFSAPDDSKAEGPVVSGMSPYTGPWGSRQILHLTRRTLFGVTPADYVFFSKLTLSQSLDILLTPSSAAAPPVNDYNDGSYTDPEIAAGKQWVRHPKNSEGVVKEKRRQCLKAWWAGLMLNQDRSVTEKMVLFWHNHLAAEFAFMNDARTSFSYVSPLRLHAMGSFKKMIFNITRTPGMLQYLSGDHNTMVAPNENYSRELQELFTAGKGPNSHYTQSDVEAAARILTGWAVDRSQIDTIFVQEWHDTGDKQFSAFYNNKTIKGRTGQSGAAAELSEMVDMIFAVKEVALNTCRCLYRWFVHSSIDSNTETHVIEPLADILLQNNYEVIPVLRALLASTHFYDHRVMGNKIKNPVDHLVGSCRQLGLISVPADPTAKQQARYYLSETLSTMGMCPGEPPNVAGWPAYYLYPSYDRLWINSDTLISRNSAVDHLLSPNDSNVSKTGAGLNFDILFFTSQLANPSDLNHLIAESTNLLSPATFDNVQLAYLKTILLSDSSDEQQWTTIWNAYMAKPDNLKSVEIVRSRLSAYYNYLLKQPECQLM